MSVTEQEVRSRIKASAARLARRFKAYPVSMVEELEVSGGSARIDIAFVGEHLIGIEIKSPKDNLSRLKRQSNHYAPYFDFLVLVADSRMVDSALEILPEHWGIIETVSKDETITFNQLRRPEHNPERNSCDLLRLLWKDELLTLLGKGSCDPKRIKDSKASLRKQIIATLDHNSIRSSCMKVLANRNNWRAKQLFTGVN